MDRCTVYNKAIQNLTGGLIVCWQDFKFIICMGMFLGLGHALSAQQDSVPPKSVEKQEAARIFDELYGKRITKVIATLNRQDDIELANELLNGLDTVKSQPTLVTLFCQKAYDLTFRIRGESDTAIKAMKLLGDLAPSMRATADKQLIVIYNQRFIRGTGVKKLEAGEMMLALLVKSAAARFEAGDYATASSEYRRALGIAKRIRSVETDRIKLQLEQVIQHERSKKRIDLLSRRLLDDKVNAEPIARELLMLYVVEMNKPADAALYLEFIKDAKLNENVRLSGKQIDELTRMQQVALGQWYHQLAKSATSTAETNMYQRALAYYEAVDADAEKDLVAVKAKRSIQQINELMEKKLTRQLGGLVKLGNVALASRGAKVTGIKNASSAAQLLDGVTTGHTSSSGYAYDRIPCTWIVSFPQRYLLREVRMLLWDGDSRYYRYTLETSVDGEKWTPLHDASKGTPRSWQVIGFRPRNVRFIRIKGLHNSSNSQFHVVEFEAYCRPPEKHPAARKAPNG